jgi:integrase
VASLYKPHRFTYRLPDGRYRTPDGKRVTKNTPGAVRVDLGRSEIWYGKFKGADGKFHRKQLCGDKTASKQMLAKLVTDAKMATLGMADTFEEHRTRPLAEHLTEWEAALRADGAGEKHVAGTVGCVRRILAGCQFVVMRDLSASLLQTFLAELREQPGPAVGIDPAKREYTKKELATMLGVKPTAIRPLVRRHNLKATGNGKARRYPRATAEALLSLRRSRSKSIKTCNLYLAAIKQFCRWMVDDRRMPNNPLVHLSGGNVKMDRRHDRRPLSAKELRSVLDAAGANERTFRGLTGRDRHFLYLAAMSSGFRAGELASLTPEAFALDTDAPTVTLRAAFAKNKRTATQPLPPDVAEALRGYLAAKPAGLPVWPGAWWDKAAEMFQADLEAAGIPYVIDGPDGPLYADFHALRHSFIALLDKCGATLKEAMQLARHSDPKLTMAVYGRAQLHDLAGAVEKLPALLSPNSGGEAVRATGTDGAEAVRPRPRLDHTDAVRCEPMRPHDNSPMGEELTERCHNPFVLAGVENDCEGMRGDEESSPRGTLFVTMRAFVGERIVRETGGSNYSAMSCDENGGSGLFGSISGSCRARAASVTLFELARSRRL